MYILILVTYRYKIFYIYVPVLGMLLDFLSIIKPFTLTTCYKDTEQKCLNMLCVITTGKIFPVVPNRVVS